jgi:hypothetical protein
MKTASSRFLETPHTRLGWWSVRLGVGFTVLFLINSFVFMPSSSDAPWRHVILPFYGIFMLLCGLGAGVVGLIAVIRQHERSWLVWLMIVPGLFVLFLLVGELLFPH